MLRGQFDRTRPNLTPSSLALNVTAERNVRLGSRNKLLYWFNTEVHFITLSRFTRLKVTVTLTSRWVLAVCVTVFDVMMSRENKQTWAVYFTSNETSSGYTVRLPEKLVCT